MAKILKMEMLLNKIKIIRFTEANYVLTIKGTFPLFHLKKTVLYNFTKKPYLYLKNLKYTTILYQI